MLYDTSIYPGEATTPVLALPVVLMSTLRTRYIKTVPALAKYHIDIYTCIPVCGVIRTLHCLCKLPSANKNATEMSDMTVLPTTMLY